MELAGQVLIGAARAAADRQAVDRFNGLAIGGFGFGIAAASDEQSGFLAELTRLPGKARRQTGQPAYTKERFE